jgi:hypothetical protein
MNSVSSVPYIPEEILKEINLIPSKKVQQSFLAILANNWKRQNNNHTNY